MSAPIWFVYLLQCNGGVLYTGITPDVTERFRKHVNGKGAKFTRINRPIRVLASKPFGTRSEASKAEWRVKNLPREQKLTLVSQWLAEVEHEKP